MRQARIQFRFFWTDLVMQPLSRVKPGAATLWGDQFHMSEKPHLAAKVAECIAEWTEIETFLGQLLGLILHTSPRAALLMFSALENRAAQLRIVSSAAESELDEDKNDLLAALMTTFIRPTMKTRDKLAHWCWGRSKDLPDALLLAEPSRKMMVHFNQNSSLPTLKTNPLPDSEIFVLTAGDLERLANNFRDVKENLLDFMSCLWSKNSVELRNRKLDELRAKPRIAECLTRLRENRQNTQKSQSQSPPPNQSSD
jgi:hypothetical protein